MRKPMIHMNGTPRAELHAGYSRAYDAVGEAIKAMQTTYPNGRDYYPQGAQACAEAAREHDRRVNDLRRILGELEELCLHTMEGAR